MTVPTMDYGQGIYGSSCTGELLDGDGRLDAVTVMLPTGETRTVLIESLAVVSETQTSTGSGE